MTRKPKKRNRLRKIIDPVADAERLQKLLTPQQFLVHLLSRIYERLTPGWDAILSRHGLTRRQYQVLWLLTNRPNWRQTDICRHLFLNKNTMVNIVDFLESNRLAKRVQNINNRRENLISVTDKGRKLVSEILPSDDVYVYEICAELTESDCRAVTDQLIKVLRAIKTKFPQAVHLHRIHPPPKK